MLSFSSSSSTPPTFSAAYSTSQEQQARAVSLAPVDRQFGTMRRGGRRRGRKVIMHDVAAGQPESSTYRLQLVSVREGRKPEEEAGAATMRRPKRMLSARTCGAPLARYGVRC